MCPFYLREPADGTQPRDNHGQVPQIAHVHIDQDFDEIPLPIDDFQIAHAAFLTRNRICQVGKR